MEKLILIISIAFICTAPISSFAEEADWKVVCSKITKLAKVMMEARQKGVPLINIIEKTNGNVIHEEMMLDAYDSPRYSTKKNQQRSVEEFSNKWYLKCAKSLRNAKK